MKYPDKFKDFILQYLQMLADINP